MIDVVALEEERSWTLCDESAVEDNGGLGRGDKYFKLSTSISTGMKKRREIKI
jgi:hypothetical protein